MSLECSVCERDLRSEDDCSLPNCPALCHSKKSDQESIARPVDASSPLDKSKPIMPPKDSDANLNAQSAVEKSSTVGSVCEAFIDGVKDYNRQEYRLNPDLAYFSLPTIEDKMYFQGWHYAHGRDNLFRYGGPIPPPGEIDAMYLPGVPKEGAD